MADLDAVKETKEYYLDIPQKSEAFYLKGSNALGWECKTGWRGFSIQKPDGQ